MVQFVVYLLPCDSFFMLYRLLCILRQLEKKAKRDVVVPDPDYRIPIVLLGEFPINKFSHSRYAPCTIMHLVLPYCTQKMLQAIYYLTNFLLLAPNIFDIGIAGGFAYQDNLLPAATVGLLGLLLLFQVRCEV